MSKQAERLYNAITYIDEDIIEAAQERFAVKKTPSRVAIFSGIAASVACIAAAGVYAVTDMNTDTIEKLSVGFNSMPDTSALMLTEVVYPEMPQYPGENNYEPINPWTGDISKTQREAWWNASKTRSAYGMQCDGLEDFCANTIRTFLREGDENKIYSPASLFMALGMSAEITDGNTREQFLDVLGCDSIDTLREKVKALWNANYADDGMAKSLISNSLWLNNDITFSGSTIKLVRDSYYAQSFVGEPGDPAYDKMLQNWLNRQTSGNLENYVSGIKLDPLTVISLASTVDYCGKWVDKFSKDHTKPGIFHAADGDKECDFMHSRGNQVYYWGEKYSAITLALENNGSMMLMLPDEGITPGELLNDDQAMAFITGDHDKVGNHNVPEVMLSMPKFDISNSFDLSDGLKELGITDAFDFSKADFSPLTDFPEVALTQAEQAARVQIDEEGCRASAMTVMMSAGAALPQSTIEMTFDRPFIFAITGSGNVPLFVGIVNDPTET
ncbi:MAG: hypothetical protein IJT87_00780 [Ruminiclostridium sp.]|nr:hypothetical protein [Ruminiclostridium sp.]